MSQHFTSKSLHQNRFLDYELIDFGHHRKLERFGKIIIDRPEINATNSPHNNPELWKSAHWKFEEINPKQGKWKQLRESPNEWTMILRVGNPMKLELKLTQFKHIGVFPEQSENWAYIQSKLKKNASSKSFLNLFAYTGAASVVAAHSSAKVTNVDSVKRITEWAKRNASINKLDNIRWIVEDARKFVTKCERRGERFNGIILDPPIYGLGTKKEHWKLERDLMGLLKSVSKVLHQKEGFIVLNTYSPKVDLAQLSAMVSSIDNMPKLIERYNLGLLSNKRHFLPLGQLIRACRP